MNLRAPRLALKTYSRLLMPERDVTETIKRLTPLLTDPELVKKVDIAAGKTQAVATPMNDNENDMMKEEKQNKRAGKLGGKKMNGEAIQLTAGNNTMLAQVVGIIIGSPEFQRR